jgi:hypothetical protein
MKRIIISEGENDTIFLKEMLSGLSIEEKKILPFDQLTKNNFKEKKFLQDRYFEKLETEWMNFDILLKSEGGKPNVVNVTITKLCYLCNKKYDPILVVDLDGGVINDFIEKLKVKLYNRFRGYNLTFEEGELTNCEDAIMCSLKLIKNTKPMGTIHVVGFNYTMEQATGIKRDFSNNEKITLSKEYLQNSQLTEMFKKALQIM